MKVLYVTPNQIMGIGGGSIGQRKLYNALQYFEANVEGAEFKVISLDNDLPQSMNDVTISKNKLKDLSARLLLHSNYIYFDFLKYKKVIKEYNPDVVILGNSRLGFIAKYFKRKRVITHFDNIEYDYLSSAIGGGIKGIIEKIAVKRDEKDCIKYSNELLFLTERDKNRAREVYGEHNKVSKLFPVVVDKQASLAITNDKITFVFFSSLSYKPNIEAVDFLLLNIVDAYSEYKFIIAGKGAPTELEQRIIEKNNVIYKPDFNRLSDFLPRNSVFISPLFSGAGMKVKIAEVLSLGLPIMASEESLVGYDIKGTLWNSGCFLCETVDDYKKAIEYFITMDKETFYKISNEIKSEWQAKYSQERGNQLMLEILEGNNK